LRIQERSMMERNPIGPVALCILYVAWSPKCPAGRRCPLHFVLRAVERHCDRCGVSTRRSLYRLPGVEADVKIMDRRGFRTRTCVRTPMRQLLDVASKSPIIGFTSLFTDKLISRQPSQSRGVKMSRCGGAESVGQLSDGCAKHLGHFYSRATQPTLHIFRSRLREVWTLEKHLN
jgi:hypothetical protein